MADADFARALRVFAAIWQDSDYVWEVCLRYDIPRWAAYGLSSEARKAGYTLRELPWRKVTLKRFVRACELSESIDEVAQRLRISHRKAQRLWQKARNRGVEVPRLRDSFALSLTVMELVKKTYRPQS